MSSEVNVLFDGPLPSAAALTRTMKELGFPLAVKRGAVLEQHKGVLPMRLRRQDSGVEFDTFNERSAIEEIAGTDIDARFTRSANFRWGGSEDEMLAGLCAAAALARLVNGIVLNEWDEHPLSAEEAIAQARETLQKTADREARERGTLGTRPADIKRYLDPLLRERSDLALIGRRLVIRPVRHLLRGAFLDRTGDKYLLGVSQFVKPLYLGKPDPNMIGFVDRSRDRGFEVWEPHFLPLLFASLRADVFEPVGKITTLGSFAAQSYEPAGEWPARVISLLLAGERDRAAEFSRRVEDEFGKDHPIGAYWQRASRDIEALCAECHSREAAAVKAMQLESIWEPTAFPVELPPAERAGLAEPAFSTARWMSEPPGLFAQAPQVPGEVRFAKGFWGRDDPLVLLVPLTRDAAEDRHNHREDYVQAARLANGLLFTCTRWARFDRNKPQKQPYVPSPRDVNQAIELRGTSYAVELRTSPIEEDPGRIEISSIDVHELPSYQSTWSCFIGRQDGEWTVHDSREGARGGYARFGLTDVIRELATIPMPEFGDYTELAARAQALLQQLGYGEVR